MKSFAKQLEQTSRSQELRAGHGILDINTLGTAAQAGLVGVVGVATAVGAGAFVYGTLTNGMNPGKGLETVGGVFDAVLKPKQTTENAVHDAMARFQNEQEARIKAEITQAENLPAKAKEVAREAHEVATAAEDLSKMATAAA